MKITLYMGISLDGYIAKNDGDSDWIGESDFAIFDEMIEKSDAIIVGNTSFEQFQGDIYPVVNKTNIVLSSGTQKNKDNVMFSRSVKEAIQICSQNNFEQVLIVGGGKVAGNFLRENCVDEVIVDVQPVILGTGIKIFENIETFVELEFLEHKTLEGGLNILKYKVKK